MEQTVNHKKRWGAVLVAVLAVVLLVCSMRSLVYGLSTDSVLETPTITKIKFIPESPLDNGGSYCVTVDAEAGQTYELLERVAGSFRYQVVDTETADGDSLTLKDAGIQSEETYYYKVRPVQQEDGETVKTGSATERVKTMAPVEDVHVVAGNQNTTITWDEVKDANAYDVYRKLGTDGTYRKIATLDLREEAKELEFTDVYADTFTDEEKETYLDGKYQSYWDPGDNNAVYAVAACNLPEEGSEAILEQAGAFSLDGNFTLQTPAISTINLYDEDDNKVYASDLNGAEVEKASISWKEVPNAEGYLIYRGRESGGDITWEQVANTADAAEANQYRYHSNDTGVTGECLTDESVSTKTVTVPYDEDYSYYTVEAFYTNEDGTRRTSDRDESMTTENRDYSDTSILYIGDSLSYGAPYTTQETGYQYSFPFRVQQLLGVSSYNASIPGATIANKTDEDCRHLVTSVLNAMVEGEKPHCNDALAVKDNTQTLEDFDVIVLEGGANDYARDVVLGELDSTDKSTFCGAINTIMQAVDAASENRVVEGKEPIKVVFMDLFYSDKNNDAIDTPESRTKVENEEGLTYSDYQEALNDLYDKWNMGSGLPMYHFRTGEYYLIGSQNCAEVSTDNLHLTAQAYTTLGTLFAEFLQKNVLN